MLLSAFVISSVVTTLGDAYLVVYRHETAPTPPTRHERVVHCTPRRAHNAQATIGRALCRHGSPSSCRCASSIIPAAFIRLSHKSAQSAGVLSKADDTGNLMFAVGALLPVGLQLSAAGVTLAVKVRAACAQLGIESAGVPVPAALQKCNEAVGLPQGGALMVQADQLVEQLGLSFDESADEQPPPPEAVPVPPPAVKAKKPRKPQRDPSMPRLVVFDLDFTLWQPELYQLSSGPPFKASKDGSVLTARGERLDLFPAARGALAELADAKVPVAIASRASEVSWALEIMRLLRVDKKRTVADVVGSSPVVIQGGSKVKHLKHIASETGIPLDEMVFFDNERSNIAEVERIGPTCVYCPRGMKDGVFRDGLTQHLGTSSSARRRGDPEEEDGDGEAGRGRRRAAGASKSKKDKKSGRGKGGRNR